MRTIDGDFSKRLGNIPLNDFIQLGFWDIVLIVGVSIQATFLAYMHHPKWKALVYSLPVPFTLASLSVNRPIDETNVLGLILLLLYTHGVRLLHLRFRVPIIIAIAASAIFYCLSGWGLNNVLSSANLPFWLACVGVYLIGVTLLVTMPHRVEPGHRTPLPVWIKLPIIAAVILFLVLIKNSLRGFMTVFPMVGVVAAYEARHSLWTIGRQIPVIIVTLIPMMIATRMIQEKLGLGLGPSLMLGWIVLIVLLSLLTRWMWKRDFHFEEGEE
jgi:hypothetical protein